MDTDIFLSPPPLYCCPPCSALVAGGYSFSNFLRVFYLLVVSLRKDKCFPCLASNHFVGLVMFPLFRRVMLNYVIIGGSILL
jgi:hypothetical protein